MESRISKETFLEKLRGIKEVVSINGIRYSNITICNNVLTGIRESTQKEFQINVNELYVAYCSNIELNTVSLKKFIRGRVQSPAYAILSHLV